MRSASVVALLCALCLVTCASAVCVSQLSSRVESIISSFGLSRARFAILASSSSANSVLLQRDQKSFSTPASNNKLLTTSTLLSQFQVNQSIVTLARSSGGSTGSLEELCMQGAWDPTITDEILSSWATAVRVHYTNIDNLVLYTGSDPESVVGFDDTWEYGDVEDDDGAAPTSFGMFQCSSVVC